MKKFIFFKLGNLILVQYLTVLRFLVKDDTADNFHMDFASLFFKLFDIDFIKLSI